MTKKTKKDRVDNAAKLKRSVLSAKSKEARAYRELMTNTAKTVDDAMIWASRSINDILKLWEKERTGATEFKSFFQWKLEGYSVKKGERAFVLWGRKRKATAKQEVEGKDDPQEEEYKFYPLAYVFSNYQVEPTEEREDRKEKEKALIINMNIEGEAN